VFKVSLLMLRPVGSDCFWIAALLAGLTKSVLDSS